MKPTVTRGATHNFQKPANWDENADEACGDLQVRAETFGKGNIVELFSTWKPSRDELLHLINGGVVEVSVCLPNQPVMSVGVVDPVPELLRKYVAPQVDDPKTLDMDESAERLEEVDAELAAFDARHCEVCGWPLAEDQSKGCIPGDCSYRPDDPAEQERMRKRRAELAARKHLTTINENAHGDDSHGGPEEGGHGVI
jgi:predicted nucleic acid-binding Zn ribbon protein